MQSICRGNEKKKILTLSRSDGYERKDWASESYRLSFLARNDIILSRKQLTIHFSGFPSGQGRLITINLLYQSNHYSSDLNKRACTAYLILTKVTPCTLLFGLASLFISGFLRIFVKYSGLIWIFFAKIGSCNFCLFLCFYE